MGENNEESIVSMSQNEFAKKVTPVKVENPDELFFFQCSCGNVHMRHAGYVEVLIPFMKADKSKNVENDSLQVMICTKCKKAYVWHNQQMYDVTSLVDLNAWEKTEKEAYKATGPGGQC